MITSIEKLQNSLKNQNVYLDNKKVELFRLYIESIKRWSKRTTIVSKRIDEASLMGLLFDSLVISREIEGREVVDLGSGAGFPGIPLSIVHNDVRVTLVEVVRKKCIFLDYIAGILRLNNVKVFCDTWDKLPPGFDTAVSMGTGYEEVRDVARRILKDGGKLIYITTKKTYKCSKTVKNPFINLTTCIIVSRETGRH